MSKTIRYTCNLCGFFENGNNAKGKLKAFYFKCDMIPQGYILSENLDSSDKHLCNECIRIIKNNEI